MGRIKSIELLSVAFLSIPVMQAQWNPEALKLAQVMDKVSRFYVDSIDDGEVVEKTIVHMLHELDPHSSYLSKEELEQLNEQLEGEFEGIGVSFNILEDTIYIIRAIIAAFWQHWKNTTANIWSLSFFIASVPQVAIFGWIAIQSPDPAILGYLIIGAPLMAIWQSVFYGISASLGSEIRNGTIEFAMISRTSTNAPI